MIRVEEVNVTAEGTFVWLFSNDTPILLLPGQSLRLNHRGAIYLLEVTESNGKTTTVAAGGK